MKLIIAYIKLAEMNRIPVHRQRPYASNHQKPDPI